MPEPTCRVTHVAVTEDGYTLGYRVALPRTPEDARYRPQPGDLRVRTVYGTDSPSLFERQAFGTKGPPDVRISTAVYDDYYARNPQAWRATGPYAPGENETLSWSPAPESLCA